MNRRRFLQTTAVAAAGLPLFTARSYARILGANDRLQSALIGCGGIGRAHLNTLLALQEPDAIDLVALCDVYDTRAKYFAEIAAASGAQPAVYHRHEDVLAHKDLDVVTIAVPEHWHARLALDALASGKHVYVEKPMTFKIDEAYQVLKKVRDTGLKMQVGVQGMSDESYATAAEAIAEGAIGPVVQAEIDYVRRYPLERGPWREDTDPKMEKPEDLDWKRWLGPAPARPWSAPRYFEWRNYKDYSGGIASDLFIHRLTRIIRACNLDLPTQVVGMGGIYLWDDGRDLPDNLEMLASYPAVKGITPGMTVRVLGTMANDQGNNHRIRGAAGSLVFTPLGWDIVAPDGKVVRSYKKEGGERLDLHHKNHHAAIREGAALHCPPELGLKGVVPITGVVDSWFKKRSLTWEADKRRWA